mgnify:CR=1 FL=1
MKKSFNARYVAVTGMLSAIGFILMYVEFSVPIMPPFIKMDLSELPALIGSFAYGPLCGILVCLIKNLLHMPVSTTACVGEFANFVVGCSFIIPASAIYAFCKNKKSAAVSCVVGTLTLTVFGTAFNAIYLLPAFAKLYKMPLETILEMGAPESIWVKRTSSSIS